MGKIDSKKLLSFIRRRICESCNRRQGIKNGKLTRVYDIGEAPCRACPVDDIVSFVETADRPCKDCDNYIVNDAGDDGYCYKTKKSVKPKSKCKEEKRNGNQS